jgi:hypothetical protein
MTETSPGSSIVPKSPTTTKMVLCAYRPTCLKTFPERGPKKYCCQGHQVKAHRKRTGRRSKRDTFREVAIHRDGGCIRRLRPEQIKNEDEMERMWPLDLDLYVRAHCKGQLQVRIVDPAKPRTLENVQTLCGRHSGRLSDQRYRERLGPELYLKTKKVHARAYYRYIAFRRKSIRIYKGPPKNPIDYLDFL